MNQPTKEQVRRFWEQCGFKFSHLASVHNFFLGDTGEKVKFWLYPDGNCDILPPIDLNNLFKYAVPKLLEKIGKFEIVALVNNAVCDAVEAKGEITDFLFWAIYKALGGKDE